MTIYNMGNDNKSEQITMEMVSFVCPSGLVRWVNEQAHENGIDSDQFMVALLYGVYVNYTNNLNHKQNAQKELQEVSPQ